MRYFRFLFFLFMLGSFLMACQQHEAITPYEKALQKDWQVQAAGKVQSAGEKISTQTFMPEDWIPARVPGTILHHLKKAGKYENLYFGKRLKKVDTTQFRQPWWYRRTFEVKDTTSRFQLLLKGINYKADIWLNGKQVASKEKINNAFRQFALPITDYLKAGKNGIAVKVYPPRPGDFSIGFVDWNPSPPDNNMGIFRNIFLKRTGSGSMASPFVVSDVDTSTLEKANLHIAVPVANHSNNALQGKVVVETQGFSLEKQIKLNPGEQKRVVFRPDEFDELTLKKPKLWWPAELGEPVMHDLRARLYADGRLSDKQNINYGIRTVSDYYTSDGHRGFRVNGKKLLIKGGGWVDDLMLGNTHANIRSQLEYVRHMNLNTVRLEGFWGKDHYLYDVCDSLGILLMAGWSCHWEWSNYLGAEAHSEWGGITSPEEIALMTKAWRDQVVWLRNHPSIFTWLGGSDMYPKPELEKNYLEIFREYDSTRVFLPSAKEWDQPLSGPSGVKMRGPYAYTPPVYWYTDTLYGGAFGFNTETGPGPQVPVYESIKKMIPKEHLWPPDAMWSYHCGRHAFNTLDRYNLALEKRYGWPDNVQDYAMKAQVLNYELMRPMFEAFSVNKFKATGVIQWMLNSAWPEMYWQLYDSYLMPTGAFYAARKASAPLSLIYNYGDHGIYLSNDRAAPAEDLQGSIQVFDMQGEKLHEHTFSNVIGGGSARQVYDLTPYLPEKSAVRFVRLLLKQDGALVHRHTYWLSGKADVSDYEAEVEPWYYYTPSAQYADFKALNGLEKANLQTQTEVGRKDAKQVMTVEVTNKSQHPAFFIELVLENKDAGEVITPVFWSDNFITLMPGEKRMLRVKTRSKATLALDVRGWNY